MRYTVTIRPSALKNLRRFPQAYQETIASAIRGLADNPRPQGCKKLTDRPGWRIRAGDYRVTYEIDDDIRTIEVVSIRHRSEAYRQR